MNIIENPFEEQLESCLSGIKMLEEKLITQKRIKNSLFVKMENFYADKLKNIYVRLEDDGRLGQISHAFVKNEKLFIHLYFLEITSNSKLIKRYSNIELDDKSLENLIVLTEKEYKEEFFIYVSSKIRSVEE